MNLDELEKKARGFLEKDGYHKSMLFIPEAHILAQLEYQDDDEKEAIRDKLRETIQRLNVNSYFTVMEGWISQVDMEKPDSPYIRPSDRVDREEALIICEYRKDMSGKQIVSRFKKVDGEVVWVDRHEADQSTSPSHWNFYVEPPSERFKQQEVEQNKAFFETKAKEFSQKYYPKMQAAKNEEERKVILREMLEEINADAEKIKALKRQVNKYELELQDQERITINPKSRRKKNVTKTTSNDTKSIHKSARII